MTNAAEKLPENASPPAAQEDTGPLPKREGVRQYSALAFVRDGGVRESVNAAAETCGWPEDAVREGGIAEATTWCKEQRTPRLLVIEITDPKSIEADMNALADVCEPHVKVIALGTINEFSFYQTIRNLGVADYLLLPGDPDALKAALAIPDPEAADGKNPASSTPVIGVMGLSGGCGATSVAVSLAHVLSRREKRGAVVLDMDTYFGDAALVCEVDPSPNFTDALEKPDRVDSLFLDRVISYRDGRLGILSAEQTIHAPLAAQAGALEALIRALQEHSAWVVVDMPAKNPDMMHVFPFLSRLLLVGRPCLGSLRDTMRWMDYLRANEPQLTVDVALNMVGMGKKHDLKPKDYAKGFGGEIAHTIPFAPEVMGIENSSELAIAKLEKSAFAKAMKGVAKAVAGEAEEEEKGKKKKGKKG